ncbi:MAG: hypothetical protein QOI55_261 [Actinomycetota bacterium]|nr:hypothetical protein [Actinomycetota bacterium]
MIAIGEVVVADDPAAWASAGFSVTNDLACIGTVGVQLAGRDDRTRGIVSWALRDAPVAGDLSIDGLSTTVAGSPSTCEAAEHPNGSTSIDHIVIATPDWPRTIDALAAVGFELRRERSASEQMRQGFFRAGEVIIEVVGPPEAARDAGPARFYGLALTVADLDETKRFFGARTSEPKSAVQPGRRITTLHHRDVGITTAIAFMSR